MTDITGTNSADSLTGTSSSDSIYSGNGNDIVDGGTGNDTIDGGNGKDILLGNLGDDILIGANGVDIVYGGEGNDTLGSATNLTSSENGTDILYGDGYNTYKKKADGSIELLQMSSLLGDDTIYGSNGADTIYGDNGTGFAYFNSDGSATFTGTGADTLYGGNGNDKIYGEVGGDTLIGGLGADQLNGGTGNDTFRYDSTLESNAANGIDTIADFQTLSNSLLNSGQSRDFIDLTALLGTTDLEWCGETSQGKVNSAWFVKDTANNVTYVHADANGERLTIKLNGIHDLTNADFLGIKTQIATVAGPNNLTLNLQSDNQDQNFGILNFNVDTDNTTPEGLYSTAFGSISYDILLENHVPSAEGQSVSMALALSGQWEFEVNTGDWINQGTGDAVNGLWKQDIDGVWQDISSSIDTDSNGQLVIHYTLTDGDSLTDSDGLINGIIVDPAKIGKGNQTPMISLVGTDSAAETISEGNTVLLTSGTLTVVDNNRADSVSATVISVTASGESGAFSAVDDAELSNMLSVTSGSIAADIGDQNNLGWMFNSNTEAFNYLATGQTLILVYTIEVYDSAAIQSKFDNQIVTITITGTNDIPVISGETSGDRALKEESDLSASGSLSIVDGDDGECFFAAASGNTSYGSYTLGVSGAWTYSLNNGNATVQALSEGETLSDSFTAVSQDGTASKVVTITITGTNDIPVISGETSGDRAVKEESDLSASGSLSIVDGDDGESTFTAASGNTSYGSYTLGVDGAWTYSLNNGNATVQALSEGETLSDSFTAVSQDGTASKAVTITITGTNDTVVITSSAQSGTVTEDADITDSLADSLTASGAVTFTDLDLTDTHQAAYTGTAAYGSFVLTTLTDTSGGLGGSQGWTYTLNNAKAQELAAGQTITETFTVTVSDGKGGSASQNVVITITGTNDAPALNAVPNANVWEVALSGAQSYDAANVGTLSGSDVDGDPLTYGISGGTGGTISPISGHAEIIKTGTYGDLHLDTVTHTYYFQRNMPVIESLADGQTVTEQFTFNVTDSHGAAATQTYLVTIHGANDAPTLTTLATGNIVEIPFSHAHTYDTGTYGTLTGSDIDGDPLIYTINGGTSGVFNPTSGRSEIVKTGTYGELHLDPTTNYYYFNRYGGAIDSLADGQTVTEKFTLTVTDSHNATASRELTITLTGANDTVVITSNAQSGAVTEDADTTASLADSLTASGAVTFTDLDLTDTHQAAYTGTAAYGSFVLTTLTDTSGGLGGSQGWTYTLNNAKAQELAAGQTITETFTVTVSDGKGGSASQNVVITITGTNDAPILADDTVSSANGFSTATGYATQGQGTVSVTVADINGDGKLDLISANTDSGTVSIMTGKGDGTFNAAQVIDVNPDSGTGSLNVVVADVDGDGKKDIVIAGGYSYSISVLSGNGDGTFSTPKVSNAGGANFDLAVADFNGDGKLDVVSTNPNFGNISIQTGNGDGSFNAAVSYATGSADRALAIGDINHDGKMDVVVANYIGNTVSVLTGKGDGTLNAAVNYGVGANPMDIAMADVNGDGNLDIITANDGDYTVSVLLGNNAGGFSSAVTYGGPALGLYHPSSVTVGDINGDGKIDIVVTNSGTNTVSVLNGNGDGTFSAPQNLGVNGTGLWSATLGDFDGDGKLDIATANSQSNDIRVLLQNTGTPTYTENGAPVTINGLITVSDVDNTSLSRATVSITGNFRAGQDALFFTANPATMGNITSSYDSAAGILTLTSASATATLAQFQAALRAVQYSNSSENPDTATRTISFQVDDGQGSNHASNAVTSTVNVVAVNDAPVLTSSIFSIAGFSAATPYGAGTNAWGTVAVTAADINGDGKLDLIAADNDSHTVSVLTGKGDGTFNAAQVLSVNPNGGGAQSVAVADVNGDGKADIVTADGYGYAVSVLTGNGDGTFATPKVTNAGGADFDLALADFNDDGKLDIVTTNPNNGNVSVQTGTGDGFFNTPVSYSTGSADRTLSIGDVNHDGKIDVVTANYVGNTVSVLTGKSDGTFNAAANYAVAGSNPMDVALADVDGDGNLDIVTANDGDYTVSVLLGKSDGTFSAATTYGGPDQGLYHPSSVTVADIDGDGKLDLVVTNSGTNTVSVLTGKGDGSFNAPVNLAVNGTGLWASAAGDFDGNGKLDIATANSQSNDIRVLLQNAGTPAYTENGAPVTINAALTVSDVDSTTLSRATVSITGNFHAGQDILSFTANSATMGNIVGSYDSASGVLTLTSANATATLAQFQAALRAVQYSNSSENPDTAPRTISFQVDDGQGSNHASNAVTSTVNVVAVNDAPTLSTISTLGGATEDTPFEISYATLAAAANEEDGEGDALSFRIETVISGALSKWDGSAWITVTPGSTLVSLDDKLQWIPEANASGNGLNAFTVKAFDGAVASEGAVQVKVDAAAVNDAPVVVAMDDTGTVTEMTALPSGNLIDKGTITFTDVDLSDTHQSWIWGYGTRLGDLGVLLNSDTTGNGTDGQLTWTYRVTASAVEYLAKDETTVESFIFALDDRNGGQITLPINVTLIGTNDTPVVTVEDVTGAVTEKTTAPTGNLTDTGTIGFNDVDLADVHSVSVITPSVGALGILTASVSTQASNVNGTGGVITWNYSVAASAVEYLTAGQTKIETFAFNLLDGKGGSAQKTVSVTITGTNEVPVANSNSFISTFDPLSSGYFFNNQNGHYYKVVTTPGAWDSAVYASTGTHRGYLATVTNVAENELLAGPVANIGGAWLGGGDFMAEGTWTWRTGPEAGQQISYTNWMPGEPNNVNNEDVLSMLPDGSFGRWNDLPSNFSLGYVAEIGGRLLDPDVAGALEDTIKIFTRSQLLANDSDADNANSQLSIAGVSSTSTLGASITIDASGNVVYNARTSAIQSLQPGVKYTDTFSYTIKDSSGAVSAPATVTLTVTGRNEAGYIAEDENYGAPPPPDYGTPTDVSIVNFLPREYVADVLPGTAQPIARAMLGIAPSGEVGDPNLQRATITGFIDHEQDVDYYQISLNVGERLILDVDNAEYFNTNRLDTEIFLYDKNYSLLVSNDDSGRSWGGTGSVGKSSSNTTSYDSYLEYSVGYSGIYYVAIRPWQNTSTFNESNEIGNYKLNLSISSTFTAPAGVAGEAAQLALTDPRPADESGMVDVSIMDLPAGWILNEGMRLDDGRWLVQTTNPAALTATTPSDFSGAIRLNVDMLWTYTDGNSGNTTVWDNVEAYAPGSPIFAWSGDDHLTGSTYNDTFVFGQPIGADYVYNFDASADKIDLMGFAGFGSFADVQAHLSADANGDAVLTLADGQTITFVGIDIATLTESNFAFNVNPVTNNIGTMIIGDGAMLPLGGEVNNAGSIVLESAGQGTTLQIIANGITLQGGGQVVLSDDDGNVITGTTPEISLTNVDNAISGAGQIGAGQLVLNNQGLIDASGEHALIIDTGANEIVNTGTLQSTGNGGLFINSALVNNGTLLANGGNITLKDAVFGSGSATIDGVASIEFDSASTNDVVFNDRAVASLKLADGDGFSGSISGWNQGDSLYLLDIDANVATLSYSVDTGVLTVTDGVDVANIKVVGLSDTAQFGLVADEATGGVIVHVV